MNTQTHMLLAGALFAKSGKGNYARNWAIAIGAIVPDAAVFVMFFWSKIVAPEREVWGTWYYNPPWSTAIDAANSIPLFAAIALIGFVLYRRNKSAAINTALLFGSLAALVHLFADFPLHVDDAHGHFWPLSHWKFISPIAYSDTNHYWLYWSGFEVLLGITLAIILWRRFSAWWVRGLCALAIIAYIVVPAYFIMMFGWP